MPPDILNLRWTGWFLVILMVIPGSIKRAGQLPIKAKGWIFLRPKISFVFEGQIFIVNPLRQPITDLGSSDRCVSITDHNKIGFKNIPCLVNSRGT